MNAGLLQRSRKPAGGHHEGAVRRKMTQFHRQPFRKRRPRSAIDLGFTQTNRRMIPHGDVADDYEYYGQCSADMARNKVLQKLVAKRNEDSDGGQQFQTVANVVIAIRPPLRKVEKSTLPGDTQNIKRQWNPQQQPG